MNSLRNAALAAAALAAIPAAGSCEHGRVGRGAVKIIATGWDNPTPQQLKRDLAEMERRPFDGVVVDVTADGQPEGIGNAPFRHAFGAGAWKEAWFRKSVTDLQSLKPARLKYLFLNLLANPGDVDWFDDAGWRDVVAHWRMAARVAKAAGMRGILFDPEPYTKPWSQFKYPAQPRRDQHPFEAYRKKARERGREVMTAVGREFPDAVILSYFLLSYVIQEARFLDQPDPAGGPASATYGLLPAFLDGWLDAVPPGITLVDGDERGYLYDGEIDYLRAANEIRGRAQALVSPENRRTYRAQVQAGAAFYLDAYLNPAGEPWRVRDGAGSRSGQFAANLGFALSAVDEYVWIYGERGRWWPLPGGTAAWNKEGAYPGWDSASAEWPARFPGCAAAIAFARDPVGAARIAVEDLRQAGKVKDRVRNGGFGEGGGKGGGKGADWKAEDAPPGWSTWQDDGSRGDLGWDRSEGAGLPGSARATGVAHGCFIQTYRVSPGERYLASVMCRNRGAGHPWMTVRWKDGAGRWTETARDVPGSPGESGKHGWAPWSAAVTVPGGARELVLLLGVTGQVGDHDAAWFDDAGVFSLE